ncbi:MAG: hypothetical protein ACYS8W_14830 [Planctomycetota bacterium]|jgi:hypothetical protein
MRIAYILAFAAAVVMCGAADAGEGAETGKVDNPEYLAWLKFKVGSFVTFKDITKTDSASLESTVTMKLVELTKDKAVVEIKNFMTLGDTEIETSSEKREIAAKINKAELPGAVKPDKTGKETIEVNGKKIKTKWEKVIIDIDGKESTMTVWKSDKIPGGIVKSETKTGGIELIKIATDYEAK